MAAAKAMEVASSTGFLNLSALGLPAVPEGTFDPDRFAQPLRRLHLSNNKISSIPSTVAALTNLTELRVDNNRLSALPLSLHKLAELRILTADGNQLTGVNPSVGQLTNCASTSACSCRPSHVLDRGEATTARAAYTRPTVPPRARPLLPVPPHSHVLVSRSSPVRPA